MSDQLSALSTHLSDADGLPDGSRDRTGVRADLHLHTTYSDGALTPAELVELCASRGLEVIAITDHNTTEGVAEAQAAATRHRGLRVIAGVEISTSQDGVHILGYLRDCECEMLQAELERIREAQRRSLEETVRRLQALGFKIEWDRVQELAGAGSAGRRHIALALVERGQVRDANEGFDRYLGRNGSAHAEMEQGLTPVEAVRLIRSAKGVAALAHPWTVVAVETLIPQLSLAGLQGVELASLSDRAAVAATVRRLVATYDLLALGGSDYHDGQEPSRMPGAQPLSDTALDALRAQLGTRRAAVASGRKG